MKRNLAILALALVILACAGTSPQTTPTITTFTWSHNDSIDVAIVREFNSQWYAKIKDATNRIDFDSLVSEAKLRVENPSWEKIQIIRKSIGKDSSSYIYRVPILDKKGKLSPCATVFFKNGLPDGFRSIPGFNAKTGEDFYYFQYAWGGTVVMMSGSEESPTKVCPKPSLFQGIGGSFPQGPSRLDLRTRVFQSVDSVGWRRIIGVAELGIEEINVQTYGSGQMKFSVKIFEIVESYDESTGESKFSKRSKSEGGYFIDLDQYTWIAALAANIEDYVITHKFELPLPTGVYEFKVEAIGENGCRGEKVDTVIVTNPQGDGVEISSILVQDPNPGKGKLDNSVHRWGTTGLWPVPNFPKGSQVIAFVEAKAGAGGEYLIEVILAPHYEDDTMFRPLETAAIFSKTFTVGEKVTVPELLLDFTNINPGLYKMIACITKPGGTARDESSCVIRVKDAKPKSTPESKSESPEIAAPKETLLNYDSLLSEFTDSEFKAFFAIEDKDFFSLIDTIVDPELFRANVIWYLKKKDIATLRGDSPENEWWGEKAAILRWGKANLKTSIDATICDARLIWILKLGIKNFDGPQSLASRPSDEFGVSVYLLRWKDGTEVEFKTLTGGSIPTKANVVKQGSDLIAVDILGRNGEGDRPAPIDYAAAIDASRRTNEILSEDPRFNPFEGITALDAWGSVSFLFSREESETEKEQLFRIYGSGSIPISSFTDSALAGDTLHSRLVIYDSSGEFVGKADEVSWGLKAYLSLSKEARDTLAFPAYVRMLMELTYPQDEQGEVEKGHLGAGRYKINFTLSADHGRQLGMIEDDFEVPPRTAYLTKVSSGIWGTSDILFTAKPVPEGNPGILIDKKLYNNNPLSISTGDSLPVLMQVKAPPMTDYLIVVTLIQVDKDKKVLRSISDKIDFSGEQHIVYTEQFRSDEDGYGIFESKVDLSPLKPGAAVIFIQAMDPHLDLESEEQPRARSYRRFHRF